MSQTFYANGEQLVDREDARASSSGIALAASLLLHLGLVGLVFFKQSDTKLPEVSPPKTAMVVTISSTNPQRKQPPTAADADIQIENPVPEIPEDQQVEAAEPAVEITTAEQTASTDQPAADQPDLNSSTDIIPASELPAGRSVESSGTPGISAAQVNNSVTAYIANYKSSLTSDWLSECLRYQNEHGVKTCPRGGDGRSETTNAVNQATNDLFRAYISGASENARASKQLLAEMEAMQPFMKENSVMGELARQRYELAKANYCGNSCRGPALITSENFADPIFDTPVSNEGSIRLLSVSIGDSGVQVGGLMSLMLEAKPQAVKPFVPYSFTATPLQQAESESEFNVEVPLFPIRE
jgi:hypothetical protein